MKTGCMFCFNLSSAAIFVHFQRPGANTSANSFLSLEITFFVADEHDSAFLWNVDIGKSHELNSCIQSEPNRFSVFFEHVHF